MHLPADELVTALRADGLRVTAPRRAICEVVAAAHAEHLSAADILGRARRRLGHNLDESTVYRTLDTLERLGILRHVHLGHGPGVYHFVDHRPHHHLVCERCGRSEDVAPTEVDPWLGPLTARHGFVSHGLHFALSGLCEACSATES